LSKDPRQSRGVFILSYRRSLGNAKTFLHFTHLLGNKKLVFAYFRFWAKVFLARTRPVVIGVTGSVGKTSMKDAIAAVLSAKFRVAKSPKTYNSEIGIPLAVLGLETSYGASLRWLVSMVRAPFRAFLKAGSEYLVLEMGIDRVGDMESNLAVTHPTIGVLGAVGTSPVHLEYFTSAEEVVREKAKMLEVIPESGKVFLYNDDAIIRSAVEHVRCPVTTFGVGTHADVFADSYEMLMDRTTSGERPKGFSCMVRAGDESVRVEVLGVVGEHHMYPIAVAIAVARACGVPMRDAARGLATYSPPPSRMRLFSGKSGSTIIDDSYNASPLAVIAAVATLASVPATRRMVCLGDMKELGAKSTEEHERIGEAVGRVADIALFVGSFARAMARGAERAGMRGEHILLADTSRDAVKRIAPLVSDGDVVLVKGSQSMRMERVTEALLAGKTDVAKLCRQDWYWKRKA